jgi:hypothetical protein
VCADAKAQIHLVEHLKGAAQDRERHNAEVSLIERHAPGHVDSLGAGFEIDRNLKLTGAPVQRDRDVQRRGADPRIDSGHVDECERMLFGLEHLVQHVPARAGNIACGRFSVESRLGAQRGLVHDEAVESNVQVRTTIVRRDVTPDVAACDDMVMPEARKRSASARFDDHERSGRIDAEHRRTSRDGSLVVLLGKTRRPLLFVPRRPWNRQRARRDQSGDNDGRDEGPLHVAAA